MLLRKVSIVAALCCATGCFNHSSSACHDESNSTFTPSAKKNVQAGVDSAYFKATIPPGTVIDSISVEKKSHIMEVFAQGKLIKKYRIALGTSPVGPKRFQNDRKTPEGLYYIDSKNPNSQFYKNLGISYPNADDIAYARRHGKSPGGDVKIHGLPPSWGDIGQEHANTDWTWGCIAVTNAQMDELYNHVKIGARIFIYYQP
ncbi:MAG: L,D-transpeptidase family protein [Chitinophagales bacterium]|nr:L,D-transpeptidase family protein [Chitinophagales bacterium]